MSGRVYLNDANRGKYWAIRMELPLMVGKGSIRIIHETLAQLEEQLGLSRKYDPSCVTILQGAIRRFSAEYSVLSNTHSWSSISHWNRKLEVSEIGKQSSVYLARFESRWRITSCYCFACKNRKRLESRMSVIRNPPGKGQSPRDHRHSHRKSLFFVVTINSEVRNDQ